MTSYISIQRCQALFHIEGSGFRVKDSEMLLLVGET
jgi:hypothetical protein